jgi:hypothetical protein
MDYESSGERCTVRICSDDERLLLKLQVVPKLELKGVGDGR